MDMRVEDNSYLREEQAVEKGPWGWCPKGSDEDEEGSDESDEMLEVIG